MSREVVIEKKHLILAVSRLRQAALESVGVSNANDEVRERPSWQAANAIEDAMKQVANKKRTIKIAEDA